AAPSVGAEDRPGFVKESLWRMLAEELNSNGADALPWWLHSPNQRVNIVALFGEPVTPQLRGQRQRHEEHCSVFHPPAQAQPYSGAADINRLGHLVPLSAIFFISRNSRRNRYLKSLDPSPVVTLFRLGRLSVNLFDSRRAEIQIIVPRCYRRVRR